MKSRSLQSEQHGAEVLSLPTILKCTCSKIERAQRGYACHADHCPIHWLSYSDRVRFEEYVGPKPDLGSAREAAIIECARALDESGDMYMEAAAPWLLNHFGIELKL